VPTAAKVADRLLDRAISNVPASRIKESRRLDSLKTVSLRVFLMIAHLISFYPVSQAAAAVCVSLVRVYLSILS
jgi:hypothetical protein